MTGASVVGVDGAAIGGTDGAAVARCLCVGGALGAEASIGAAVGAEGATEVDAGLGTVGARVGAAVRAIIMAVP